jgi:hypothetical protein
MRSTIYSSLKCCPMTKPTRTVSLENVLAEIAKLKLTLELLNEWREPEPELPSKVIRFRPRRSQ